MTELHSFASVFAPRGTLWLAATVRSRSAFFVVAVVAVVAIVTIIALCATASDPTNSKTLIAKPEANSSSFFIGTVSPTTFLQSQAQYTHASTP